MWSCHLPALPLSCSLVLSRGHTERVKVLLWVSPTGELLGFLPEMWDRRNFGLGGACYELGLVFCEARSRALVQRPPSQPPLLEQGAAPTVFWSLCLPLQTCSEHGIQTGTRDVCLQGWDFLFAPCCLLAGKVLERLEKPKGRDGVSQLLEVLDRPCMGTAPTDLFRLCTMLTSFLASLCLWLPAFLLPPWVSRHHSGAVLHCFPVEALAPSRSGKEVERK